MELDHFSGRIRLLAWLTGPGTLFGLLFGTALFLATDEAGWAVSVFALTTGLAGVFALISVRSAPASVENPAQPARQPPPARCEPGDGLPVCPVTGLYRWWVVRDRLSEEIARAARYKHDLAVMLLEPAELLKEPTPEAYALAAKALRHALRTSDYAGQFDEERFVVLLPETDIEGARTGGRRLLAALRSGTEPSVRWRGALVAWPEDGDSPDALLDQAMIMLRQGRLESATKSASTPRLEPPPSQSAA